jgi:hypothetical protein
MSIVENDLPHFGGPHTTTRPVRGIKPLMRYSGSVEGRRSRNRISLILAPSAGFAQPFPLGGTGTGTCPSDRINPSCPTAARLSMVIGAVAFPARSPPGQCRAWVA